MEVVGMDLTDGQWAVLEPLMGELPQRDELPSRLIGDRAYDSDPLDAALALLDIEMIAPHRRGRVRPKTQDGRPLRRFKRRWKVERLFAWLGNFRRLVVRYERHSWNDLGFVHLGCILILLKRCL
jgi:transposase